jgi:hypothetical protein
MILPPIEKPLIQSSERQKCLEMQMRVLHILLGFCSIIKTEGEGYIKCVRDVLLGGLRVSLAL